MCKDDKQKSRNDPSFPSNWETGTHANIIFLVLLFGASSWDKWMCNSINLFSLYEYWLQIDSSQLLKLLMHLSSSNCSSCVSWPFFFHLNKVISLKVVCRMQSVDAFNCMAYLTSIILTLVEDLTSPNLRFEDLARNY